MDEQDVRGRLDQRLRALDWSRGLSKTELTEELSGEGPLRYVIDQHLADGTYFSSDDVLNALPASARDEAAGDAWRFAGFAEPVPAASMASDTPLAAAQNLGGEATGVGAGTTGGPAEHGADSTEQAGGEEAGAVAHVRQAVGQATHAVTETAARVAEQARERAGAAAHAAAGIGDIPERVRQTASQAKDQVVSIRPRRADAGGPETRPADAARRAIPVGLSAVVEGLGQAYNRQPGKALVFAALGLTLSTVSGLNTWIVRRVFGMEGTRLGPERVRPALLGLWSATFVLSLWDAWRHAGSGDRRGSGAEATVPSNWSGLDPARPPASTTSPTAATDEFPVVGNG